MRLDHMKQAYEEQVAALIAEFEEKAGRVVGAIDQDVVETTELGSAGRQFTRWVNFYLEEGDDE